MLEISEGRHTKGRLDKTRTEFDAPYACLKRDKVELCSRQTMVMGAPGFAGYSLWGTISRDEGVLSLVIHSCPVAMLSSCSSPVKIRHSTSTVQCSMTRSESYCIVNGCFFLFLSLISHLVSCQYAYVGLFLQQTFFSEMQQHRYRAVIRHANVLTSNP